MTQKWFKATDVCEMAELQPYVLRSWEKEFPGIGVQKSPESPRLYRQSDVEQVLKIKQLVFGEGLTLSGARRRMEEHAQPRADQTSPSAGRWRPTRGRALRMLR
jgi:DNA-binding transcriptional MerR regulator